LPSVLTSTYTWEHGSWRKESPLAESVPTWAESFSKAGYRTVGLVHSPNGSSIFGYDRGFQEFYELFRGRPDKSKPVLADKVLPALEEVLVKGDDRPLFLWMHIVEPHEPYTPPAPWAGKLTRNAPGELDGVVEDLVAIRERRVVPTPADLERIAGQYSENLCYVDDVFARIRERLEMAGIFQEAVVVFFSDHGEGFMLHETKANAALGHGLTVYDDMARIPLVARLPEGVAPAGLRLDRVATNLDILPTIADLVGLGRQPAGSRGTSFAPLLFGADRYSRDSVVTHSWTLMAGRRFLPNISLRHGPWKYIHASGSRPELYHLPTDPDEQTNLADERSIVAGYLRQRLCEKTGFDLDAGGVHVSSSATTVIGEEALEQMRALGYAR